MEELKRKQNITVPTSSPTPFPVMRSQASRVNAVAQDHIKGAEQPAIKGKKRRRRRNRGANRAHGQQLHGSRSATGKVIAAQPSDLQRQIEKMVGMPSEYSGLIGLQLFAELLRKCEFIETTPVHSKNKKKQQRKEEIQQSLWRIRMNMAMLVVLLRVGDEAVLFSHDYRSHQDSNQCALRSFWRPHGQICVLLRDTLKRAREISKKFNDTRLQPITEFFELLVEVRDREPWLLAQVGVKVPKDLVKTCGQWSVMLAGVKGALESEMRRCIQSHKDLPCELVSVLKKASKHISGWLQEGIGRLNRLVAMSRSQSVKAGALEASFSVWKETLINYGYKVAIQAKSMGEELGCEPHELVQLIFMSAAFATLWVEEEVDVALNQAFISDVKEYRTCISNLATLDIASLLEVESLDSKSGFLKRAIAELACTNANLQADGSLLVEAYRQVLLQAPLRDRVRAHERILGCFRKVYENVLDGSERADQRGDRVKSNQLNDLRMYLQSWVIAQNGYVKQMQAIRDRERVHYATALPDTPLRPKRRRRKNKNRISSLQEGGVTASASPNTVPQITQPTTIPQLELTNSSATWMKVQSMEEEEEVEEVGLAFTPPKAAGGGFRSPGHALLIALNALKPSALVGSLNQALREQIRHQCAQGMRFHARHLGRLLQVRRERTFSSDERHRVVDLCRRLIEGALTLAIARYPIHSNGVHILAENADAKSGAIFWGHDLRVPALLLYKGRRVLPATVSQALHQGRPLINRLAMGNRLLHYREVTLHHAGSETSLEINQLIKILDSDNSDDQSDLDELILVPTYRLVEALLYETEHGAQTQYQVDKELRGWIQENAKTEHSCPESIPLTKSEQESPAEPVKPVRITSRTEALYAVRRTRAFVKTIENRVCYGSDNGRRQERDAYLRDLKRHLTSLESCLKRQQMTVDDCWYALHETVRGLRALHVAALLHLPLKATDSNQHLVYAPDSIDGGRSLAFTSDIVRLNQHLRDGGVAVSQQLEEAPDLTKGFGWLRWAHRMLNNPACHLETPKDPNLGVALVNLASSSEELWNARGLPKEFTTIVKGVAINPEQLQHQSQDRVKIVNERYLYPALEILMNSLGHVFPHEGDVSW